MISMKKILAGILCAALLLLPLGIFPHASDTPPKFAVLGDSIAAGAGVSDKEDAYAWLVARAKGYELSNCAQGGDTSANLLGKVTGDETIRQCIREADIIAVSIGGNDVLTADFVSLVRNGLLGDYSAMEPVLDTFRENFAAIIGELRALNPDATLAVQTLYNPAFPLPSLLAVYEYAVKGINGVICGYLGAHPGAYVVADVYAAFAPRSGMVSTDRVHPAAAGHAIIAMVLLDAINGTQTQLPPADSLLDFLLCLFRPVLAALDWVLIGGLRVLYTVFSPVFLIISEIQHA